ncbi:lipid droplet-regulating VLDL assembly factor AUP1-like [Ischnura elegans]|uniref:lipid droplet-regulating VLDL assembly factor AUP1-like n=1 Tax=Ischnura elegans TaxID=197161 RepID=UPI001ED8A40E|nr:lipid droplet-regulating VLDL assembly factor AUP1-like [Ischnura elegans]
MSRVGINELFDESRFPTGWSAMPLLFYFPLGLALATIRFFIGFQAYLAASLLPQLTLIRSFVLRSMSLVLGIVVQQESLGNRDKSVKVIVANYLTPFDHLAMHLVEGTVTPNSWGWPSSLGEAVGVMDLGVKQGSESLIQNAANHLMKPSAAPLFAQPEGGSTNGKKGLLKFSTWPFSLGSAATSVQPVALSVWRPGITDLSPSPLASRPWMDLFWFLFVPFTLFTVRYLPCVQKKEGETNEEFSDRVQELVAANLNLIPTKYTVADKAEHEKRHLMELARASLAPSHSSVAANPSFNVRSRIRSPMSLSSSSEIQRMARQVKEVLPHVPIDAITRDLVRTLSVDVTIANILEGQVAFQPEPTTPAPSPATAKPSTKYSPTCSTPLTPSSSPMSSSLDTSAPSFPKTASERMLSFQQRKDRLIENARRKYIEKNGLKIAGFNC